VPGLDHQARAKPAERGFESASGDRRRLAGQDLSIRPDGAGKRNGPFAEIGSDVDRNRT
jgi:hypothetical protein